MRRIEAIVRHYKLEDVKNALAKAGITGMTVVEVRGFGRQRGHKEVYRGTEYVVDFVPKICIQVVVSVDDQQKALDAILESARTGEVGDGKIFISDLVDVVRIRTGESGPEAL